MFKKIIVGLDGSDQAERALRIACDIAGKYRSEVHLIHTPQPKTVAFALGAATGYHMATTMPAADEVKKACDKILDAGEAVAKTCGVTKIARFIGHGNPADEIVGYAEKCGADLIVTGRRGLSSLGALVQGSTTQQVNHKANCVCMSVV